MGKTCRKAVEEAAVFGGLQSHSAGASAVQDQEEEVAGASAQRFEAVAGGADRSAVESPLEAMGRGVRRPGRVDGVGHGGLHGRDRLEGLGEALLRPGLHVAFARFCCTAERGIDCIDARLAGPFHSLARQEFDQLCDKLFPGF